MSTGFREIALACTSLLLFVGAMEGVSRWIVPTDVPDPMVSKDIERWGPTRESDPLLFWRLKRSVEIDGQPFTNRLGLRWPEVEPKREGEFRILSLGESSTFARRIDPAGNYSALLGSGLATVDGRRVVVVNAGVPGYTLFQGYQFLRHRSQALEPDAVLLYFGINDFLPVSHLRERQSGVASGGSTDREAFERTRRPAARLLAFLLRYSNAVRFLVFRGGAPDATVEADPDRVRVPEADRRWLLGTVLELCRERGLDLVIAVPWYREFREHAPLLREFAAENGVPIVDLPTALRDLPLPPVFHFFGDALHPNALGHRRIAEALTESLRETWQP